LKGCDLASIPEGIRHPTNAAMAPARSSLLVLTIASLIQSNQAATIVANSRRVAPANTDGPVSTQEAREAARELDASLALPAQKTLPAHKGMSFALGSVGRLARKLRSGVVGVVRNPEDTWVIDEEEVEETWFEIFMFGIFYIMSATIFALLYKMFTDGQAPVLSLNPEKQSQTEGFEHGLFSCEKCGLELFICSVFCLCIRWPKTVSNDKLGNGTSLITFWGAFFIFVVLDGFMGSMFGLLWVVQLALCAYFRQKIRARYGLPNGTTGTWVQDVLSWACCCFCAIAQEAKQVEGVDPKVESNEYTKKAEDAAP